MHIITLTFLAHRPTAAGHANKQYTHTHTPWTHGAGPKYDVTFDYLLNLNTDWVC